MRIRTLKPSFWRSDDITALPMDLRLLFIGLWSYVDDNGVGINDYRQIAADLFALEEDQTAVRAWVREGLATLSRGSLVTCYMIEDRSYIFITKWDKHQKIDRPNVARFPRPPDDFDPSTSRNGSNPDQVATPSRHPRDTPSSVVGNLEQGNRGREEERTCARSSANDLDTHQAELTLIEPPGPSEAVVPISRRADETFTRFWAAYPRKKAKPPARTAWDKAIKRADPETIIGAAQRLAHSKPDLKFTPYPATWLNRDSWNDEPDPINSGGYQGYQEPADPSVYHEGLLS